MIVVADTSPICYLVLIGEIELLFHLFGKVIIPQAVYNELSSSSAPILVQNWIVSSTHWLEVQTVSSIPDKALERLHSGEKEAILLTEKLNADLIILDEKAARKVAKNRGLKVTGLLGLLDLAATRGLIDLPTVIYRLQQTNFRASSRLLNSLLDENVNK